MVDREAIARVTGERSGDTLVPFFGAGAAEERRSVVTPYEMQEALVDDWTGR